MINILSTPPLPSLNQALTINNFLRFGKTGNNDLQLVLLCCCKVSWIVMLHILPPMNQTCLVTNQVVAGCKTLLQKVERNSTFSKKISTCCAFYRLKANLFCGKWWESSVRLDSCVILHNQKSVFTQLATTWFVGRQVRMLMAKCAT